MYMKSHEEMLESLYARREAYEKKKSKQKRAAMQVTGIAACFVLCTAVVLGSYQKSEPPVTPGVSAESEQSSRGESLTEESSEGDLSEGEGSQGEASSESESPEGLPMPGALVNVHSFEAAVVEITEVTDEKIQINSLLSYRKLNCRVLYYHGFLYEAFPEAEYILVFEDEAKNFTAGDIVFFKVQSHGYESKAGYGPRGNYHDEKPYSTMQYITFEDGKLIFEETQLENASFLPIFGFNRCVRWEQQWAIESGKGFDPAVYDKYYLRSGSTVEEIREYFRNIDEAYEKHLLPIVAPKY